MNFDLFSLLLAAGSGFFAAAIGALHAFIFTGFMVVTSMSILLAGGSSSFLSYVAFGPVFGPHVSFAAGVAAAAYAARKSTEVGGKDIGVPLISLQRPDVLLVGAVFGMGGYVLQLLVAQVPWFGSHTDSVAVTVIISALVVRLAIGRSSIFGTLPAGAGWGRFAPRDEARWIKYHEKFVPNTFLGFMVGLLAAGATIKIAELYPSAAGSANTFMFGVSAISLLFLSLGVNFPVTHHITLIAGLAALTFLPIVGGNTFWALLIGAVCGMVAAWFAEFFARFLHDHGNTHIDPPAAAIWPMTTIILAAAAVLT